MMRLLVLIVFLLGMSIPKGVHSTCYDRGVIALTFDDGMSIRSLQIAAVLEEKQIKNGIRTSLENFSRFEKIDVIPGYAISNLYRS